MTPSHLFNVGDVVATRFRIRQFLGRGGMGEVDQAEDLDLPDRVALKTILGPNASEKDFLDRFRREIHLARRITHPNVCRVHDIYRHPAAEGEVLLLSMELLEGETLTQRLRRAEPLDRQQMMSIARQVSAALTAMHAASIIHRDLKSTTSCSCRTSAK